jgi:hypothetical protein
MDCEERCGEKSGGGERFSKCDSKARIRMLSSRDGMTTVGDGR